MKWILKKPSFEALLLAHPPLKPCYLLTLPLKHWRLPHSIAATAVATYSPCPRATAVRMHAWSMKRQHKFKADAARKGSVLAEQAEKIDDLEKQVSSVAPHTLICCHKEPHVALRASHLKGARAALKRARVALQAIASVPRSALCPLIGRCIACYALLSHTSTHRTRS